MVAESLDVVVPEAAAVLRTPPGDPFARELVVVPGDGIRTWLVQSLARALGDGSGDGIVANVDFVYPGALVRSALGATVDDDPWSIGALTWSIHALLQSHGSTLGVPADLLRARAIADLFDRYSLHRATMIHAWERGLDLGVDGQALPAAARWQPRLWRLLVERLGVLSPATRTALAIERLRAGADVDGLPERVVVFGVAGLPAAHLDLLGALASGREVHVFAPVPSLAWWRRLRPTAATLDPVALLRAHDATTTVVAHPLSRSWSRSQREGHLGMLAAAIRSGAVIREVSASTSSGAASSDAMSPDAMRGSAATSDLLGRLQQSLRADEWPDVSERAARTPLAADDHSVQWHRCHGLGRQVEVLRDVVLRLLDERLPDGRPRWEPRDILIVCTDVAAVAPLAEAAFAGNGPGGSLPSLPLRVADRSLRRDMPVFDVVLALFELLDGRLRVTDLLSMASLGPVAHRFGFTPHALGRLAHWLEATHVRWGLDGDSREAFGVRASFAANTWRAGLDQLLLGAALADSGPRIGPGGVVPYGDLEGDDLALLGSLAEFVDAVGRAIERLRTVDDVVTWCDAVVESAQQLCSLDDADSWHWDRLEGEMASVRDEARAAGADATLAIDPAALASLVSSHLGGRPGRPRFGTGAITLSSFTAQRGVPFPVVCMLGLDGDLGAGGTAAADDLIAQQPCVGDREPRSELRAQLLDTVLAARDRLVLCSTGRSLATNAEVPPAIVLAELIDVIDEVAAPPSEGHHAGVSRARDAITVDHPRQAWSEANFRPGELGLPGPWSFDAVARRGAECRRRQDASPLPLDAPLVAVEMAEVGIEQLRSALRSPAKVLLKERLGIGLSDPPSARDDLVPLSMGGLDAWGVADDVLTVCRSVPVDGPQLDARVALAAEARLDVLEARGALPPLGYGKRFRTQVLQQATAVHRETMRLLEALGAPAQPTQLPIDVTVDGVRVSGNLEGVHGDTIVVATVSKLQAKHQLAAWLALAAATATDDSTPRRALLVGTKDVTVSGAKVRVADAQLLTITDHEAALQTLVVVIDLYRRSLCDAVPFFADTSHALHFQGPPKARGSWEPNDNAPSDSDDTWTAGLFGPMSFESLLALEARADESGDSWGTGCRAQRWASRIWGTFERAVQIGTPTAVATSAASDSKGADDDS